MANVFWVRCSAAGELPHHGTWRHCVMWRIDVHHFRALPEANTERDIWQSGNGLILRIKPPATSFGDTLAFVLDYQRPAIAAFKTLLSSGNQSGVPVRAPLQFDRPANTDIDPPRNTLKLCTTGVVEFDLPMPLQIIDTKQRGIFSATGTSNAPVHVIHGLAGCGKSMMMQCLVAIYATHHSRLSDMLMTLAPKPLTLQVLRHEFLQCLLHSAYVQPERVLFGGRLPDNCLEAGVLDNDQKHIWNIMLGKADVRSATQRLTTWP
ncbi:MAG: hypothetical protein ACKPKO_06430, partial [Candidatus Fonsibacter sp.]